MTFFLQLRDLSFWCDKESSDESIHKARQTLFTPKGREITNIPLTRDALHQHRLRVGFQAGHDWGQVLCKTPQLTSLGEFGWKQKNSIEWEVHWKNLPPAGAVCRAVVKCGCTKGWGGRCRRIKENLPSALLCKCGGCQCLGYTLSRDSCWDSSFAYYM